MRYYWYILQFVLDAHILDSLVFSVYYLHLAGFVFIQQIQFFANCFGEPFGILIPVSKHVSAQSSYWELWWNTMK